MPASHDTRGRSQRGKARLARALGAHPERADVSREPDYYSISGWKAGSEICVPIRDADQVIGLINLEKADKNAFKDTDVLLLESLAGILSSVLINARRDRVFVDFTDSLIVETEVAELLNLIVNGIQKHLSCSGAGIYQHQETAFTDKASLSTSQSNPFVLLSWCGVMPALDFSESSSGPLVTAITKDTSFQFTQDIGTQEKFLSFLITHSLEDLISARISLNRAWISSSIDSSKRDWLEVEEPETLRGRPGVRRRAG